MDLIAGKNSTWLNPPHIGGIIDPDASCPSVYCNETHIAVLMMCEGGLCDDDYCAGDW